MQKFNLAKERQIHIRISRWENCQNGFILLKLIFVSAVFYLVYPENLKRGRKRGFISSAARQVRAFYGLLTLKNKQR